MPVREKKKERSGRVHLVAIGNDGGVETRHELFHQVLDGLQQASLLGLQQN